MLLVINTKLQAIPFKSSRVPDHAPSQWDVKTGPCIYDFDLRVSHTRTLLPVAFASASFGFVFIRFRVPIIVIILGVYGVLSIEVAISFGCQSGLSTRTRAYNERKIYSIAQGRASHRGGFSKMDVRGSSDRVIEQG